VAGALLLVLPVLLLLPVAVVVSRLALASIGLVARQKFLPSSVTASEFASDGDLGFSTACRNFASSPSRADLLPVGCDQCFL
jgi:hypothetical protein